MSAWFEDVARDLLSESKEIALVGVRPSLCEDVTRLVFSTQGLGVHEITFSGLEIMQNGTVANCRNLIASRIANACLETAGRIIEQVHQEIA